MAYPAPRASRLLLDVFRPTRPRPICQCLRIGNARRKGGHSRRQIFTAPAQRSEMEVDTQAPPRWSQTPPAMKAPVPARTRRTPGGRHEVNKDPRKLDDMYIRFLGDGGDQLLSEETKWLAITHKSFDHGKRGFNDRLAFIGMCYQARKTSKSSCNAGKRIVELQTSLGLLSVSESSNSMPSNHDTYGRKPFEHPAIDAVESLSEPSRTWLTYHKQIAKVAEEYGLPAVMRWVPKNVSLPKLFDATKVDMVAA